MPRRRRRLETTRKVSRQLVISQKGNLHSKVGWLLPRRIVVYVHQELWSQLCNWGPSTQTLLLAAAIHGYTDTRWLHRAPLTRTLGSPLDWWQPWDPAQVLNWKLSQIGRLCSELAAAVAQLHGHICGACRVSHNCTSAAANDGKMTVVPDDADHWSVPGASSALELHPLYAACINMRQKQSDKLSLIMTNWVLSNVTSGTAHVAQNTVYKHMPPMSV